LLTPLIELIILWGGRSRRSPPHSQLSTRFFLPPQLCTLLDQTHLPPQLNQLAQSTSLSHPITSLYPPHTQSTSTLPPNHTPSNQSTSNSHPIKPPYSHSQSTLNTCKNTEAVLAIHTTKHNLNVCNFTHTHTCFFLMNHLRNALFPKPLFSL